MTNAIAIFCTCPDRTSAEKIARTLVESNLAACANILPNLTSVYSWQGQIETADEHLLIIKATEQAYAAIEKSIQRLHPYELPEIIALSIAHGLPEYLNWIHSCRAVNPSS